MMNWWREYRMRRQMRKQMPAYGRNPTKIGGRGLLGTIFGIPGAIARRSWLWLQTISDAFASPNRYRKDLLLGLPAMLVFLGFVGITALGNAKQTTNAQRYWTNGVRLLSEGKAEAAQTLLQKALLSEIANRQDVIFALARAYEEGNDIRRADALMETLAPVGIVGFPAAHRYMAIRMGERLAVDKQVSDLQSWQWHLSHADQTNSTSLQKSWGYYYLLGGDLAAATQHFRTAAAEEPELWLQVAELEARMENMDAVRNALAVAKTQLEQQFLKDPGNKRNRLSYATSLFYMGALPDAERLLKEGLAEEDNQGFRQLLAAVFVRMYDVEMSELGGGIEKAFGFLGMALQYDPNYQQALTRLVQVSRSSEEKLTEAKDTMRRLISEGNASAMAHFALGSLEMIAGNRELAKLNMQQAIALDKRLVVVANNLAYLILQEEQPDLEVALNLANQAVAEDPKNPDYLDTRAAIHLRMGSLAAAAVDYQLALDTWRMMPEVMRRDVGVNAVQLQGELAKLYEQMGDSATAAKFRQAVQGAQSTRSE